MSKYFDWDDKKNLLLKLSRGISFEETQAAIESEQILDIIKHPNIDRSPNQKIYIVRVNDYAYCAPFVEDEEKIFLKTIYPSKKLTIKYKIKKPR